MKKPDKIDDFKHLLSDMEHRERFVFNASDAATDINPDIKYVEIYCTCLYETSTFSNGLDRNIKVSFVDICGKQIAGRAYSINKYLRLWTDDFYNKIFSFIA